MKDNKNTKKNKCNVCETEIDSNAIVCPVCGWVQQTDFDDTDKITWSNNFVSLNKAKALYKAGKPIKPDFDDLIQCLQVYSELQFFYNRRKYGIIRHHQGKIDFYEWDNMNKGYQSYNTLNDFKTYANIDGKLLSKIWQNIENFGIAD